MTTDPKFGLTATACLLLCWAAGAAASAQGTAPAGETPASGATPRIEVAETEVDLGSVDRGETVEARFVIRNTGDATLRILNAKPG